MTTINVYVNGDGDPSEIAEQTARSIKSLTRVMRADPLDGAADPDVAEKLAKITNDWNIANETNKQLAKENAELREEEKRLNTNLRRTTEKLIDLRREHGDERPVGGSTDPEVRAVEMVEAAAVRAEKAEAEEASAAEQSLAVEADHARSFEFDLRGDEDDPLAAVITQAIGAGSSCWENLRGAGVFESTRAKEIAEKTIEWVRDYIADRQPNLGLAMTGSLLDEIRSRIEVDYSSGGGGLGYTTVYGRPDSWGAVSSKPRVKLPTSVEPSYSVEVGGQRFTAEQWEALQPYVEGRIRAEFIEHRRSEPANPEFRAALLDYLGFDADGPQPGDGELIEHFRNHFGSAKNPEAGK